MAKDVQMVGQPTSQAAIYTGSQRQIIVDTGLWTVRVHDGITPGGFALLNASSNLGDLVNIAQARTNLGLGSAATQNSSAFDAAGTAASASAAAVAAHAALTNTHGVSGAIVGTNNAQTLTQKTFSDTITSTMGLGQTLLSNPTGTSGAGGYQLALTYGPFAWTNGPAGQTNYIDDVWALGMNITNPGQRIDTAKPAVYLQWESKFYQTSVFASEFHLETIHIDGTTGRPLTFFMPHTSHVGSGMGVQTDTVVFAADGAAFASMQLDSINYNLDFAPTMKIRATGNNVPVYVQQNSTGSAFVNGIFLNSTNQHESDVPIYVLGNSTSVIPLMYGICTGAVDQSRMIHIAGPSITGELIGVSTFMGASNGIYWHINNQDATSSTSHSGLHATVGGASSGDPYVQFEVNGISTWRMGVDNSASDAFVLSQGSALGTNNVFSVNFSTLAFTLNGALTYGGVALSNSATGTGSMVLATSPTLVTPNLGTPSAVTLTNATGLPLTGLTGLATGVATFLGTPSSANLAAVVTDETGTGALVFAASPTFSGTIGGTLAFSGAITHSSTTTLSAALTYGGVTLANAVTGTGNMVLSDSAALTTALTITGASSNALAVGRQGATNPAFNVDASTASSNTGINIKSAAAAGRVALSVLSSNTNEGLNIDAKGSGTIILGATSTGGITLTRAVTLSSSINNPDSSTVRFGNVNLGGTWDFNLVSTTANGPFNVSAGGMSNGGTLATFNSGTTTGTAIALSAAGTASGDLQSNVRNLHATGIRGFNITGGSTSAGDYYINFAQDAGTAWRLGMKPGLNSGAFYISGPGHGGPDPTLPDLAISAVTGGVTIVNGLTLSTALTYGGVTLSNSVTGTGSMVLAASPSITGTLTAATATFSGVVTHSSTTTLSGALTYGGVTLANAVTGTGNMVLSASPTLTGTLTAAAATFSGVVTHSSTTTLSGALTYGGVTLSNSVTGTGNMVLSASPTLTGTLTAAGITMVGAFDQSGSTVKLLSGSAIPAGGVGLVGFSIGSTSGFGVYIGSGSPTLSAAKGSLYLRSDGSTINNRAYINTDGGSTWTAITTVA